MKLDKIKFAWLIAFVTKHGAKLGTYEIEDIDNLCTFEVQLVQVDPDLVDNLMALMVEGTRKIEAIKTYRYLTSQGLKESKEAVERYWVSKGHYQPVDKNVSLSDIPDYVAGRNKVGNDISEI